MPLDRKPRLVRHTRGAAHSRRHRQLPDARRRMEQEPRHERRPSPARPELHPRQPLASIPAPTTSTRPNDPHWNYVGTLDNDATNTELRFLALVSAATPGPDGEAYRASFLRGIRYLLAAQFPNGGWPQVWPLEGGYHDAITFNDNAVTESAETAHRRRQRVQATTAFVPADLRRQAAAGRRPRTANASSQRRSSSTANAPSGPSSTTPSRSLRSPARNYEPSSPLLR